MDTKWKQEDQLGFLQKSGTSKMSVVWGIACKWKLWVDVRELKGKIGNTWCQSECRGEGEGEVVSRMALTFLG